MAEMLFIGTKALNGTITEQRKMPHRGTFVVLHANANSRKSKKLPGWQMIWARIEDDSSAARNFWENEIESGEYARAIRRALSGGARKLEDGFRWRQLNAGAQSRRIMPTNPDRFMGHIARPRYIARSSCLWFDAGVFKFARTKRQTSDSGLQI